MGQQHSTNINARKSDSFNIVPIQKAETTIFNLVGCDIIRIN